MKKNLLFGSICMSVLLALFANGLRNCFFKSNTSIETAVNIPQDDEIQSVQNKSLNHLACIMDGNRRWAKKKGLEPWYGHQEGIEAVRKVIEFCLKKNIKYLSLYTFSLENFNRSIEENTYLFNLMTQEAQKGAQEFKEHGIRVRFIGDRSLFPEKLRPLLENIEKETEHLDNLHLFFLFCYGSRQEITKAAQAIAYDVSNNIITADQITPELISGYLWTHDIPDPDLIIRTGKVSRLSNFLLYQAAYSELYMLDCLWPDLTQEDLEEAYNAFTQSNRNFGK